MTDSILIVGGGPAGLHAALQCAGTGANAIVVEHGPVVGGRLAATMLKPSAIGDRSEGVRTPLFEALVDNEKIEILTQSDLESIEGRPGNFTVSIRERARFVTDACTRCKNCNTVCPVVLPNEFDAGLTYRKAIYTPLSDTLPAAYVIDVDSCLNTPPNYLPCQRCVDVCDDHAIFFNLALNTSHQRQVGAVILAPGFRIQDPARFAELGYGTHPDIVTSAELQRLLESPGPTGGFASKPSNEEYPESVLLVLDNPSPFALYIAASQVHQLRQQDIYAIAVLMLSQPTGEREAAAAKALENEAGIEVYWGTMFKAGPAAENALEVSYEDLAVNRYVRRTYDMVVLCSDVEPAEGMADLAAAAGVELSEDGYIKATGSNGSSTGTSRPGVYVAGCASGPKNIRDSLTEAQAAAVSAAAQLDPRLLQPEGAERLQSAAAETTAPVPPDQLRRQLEQLLNALVNR